MIPRMGCIKYIFTLVTNDEWACFSLVKYLMSDGIDNDATIRWFSRFESVSLVQKISICKSQFGKELLTAVVCDKHVLNPEDVVISKT